MKEKMNSQKLLDKIFEEYKAKKWEKKPYNIFNACGKESDELMHSFFIANLLNPSGTHACGDIFLKSFIEVIKEKYSKFISEVELDILAQDVYVQTEKVIGRNRIDIWIKSKSSNAYLLIENKIYARDQKNQLLRYRNYLKGKRKGILLYLTPNGKDASEYSTGGVINKNDPNGYFTISYYETIKGWLSSCLENLPSEVEKKKLCSKSRIKSSLEQYIELIDFLVFNANLRDEILKEADGNLVIDKEVIKRTKKLVDNDKKQENRKEIISFLDYLSYSYKRKNQEKEEK